jgi:hypothetical protein
MVLTSSALPKTLSEINLVEMPLFGVLLGGFTIWSDIYEIVSVTSDTTTDTMANKDFETRISYLFSQHYRSSGEHHAGVRRFG